MKHILLALAVAFCWQGIPSENGSLAADRRKVKQTVRQGLDWVAHQQSRLGHWTGNNGAYPTAMTALAGMALAAEGSTTTQGRYAENIRRAVDYLVSHSRHNGLIGNPNIDARYTYGHGFAMLFLSQVLGEEEDEHRRKELVDVLTRAVQFTGEAQTKSGGWGYVSAKDGNNFDEGSTTVTQVQGLRGCRNAGIPVPKEVIERAITYIHKCTGPDGGVKYRLSGGFGGGGRPPITAAAIACLFNAGEYDGKYVPKVLTYCKKHLYNIGSSGAGHWHYAHLYYSQVLYRQDGKDWSVYRDKITDRLVREATTSNAGSRTLTHWNQGHIGPIYTTSINLTILQLEKGMLPIYQR